MAFEVFNLTRSRCCPAFFLQICYQLLVHAEQTVFFFISTHSSPPLNRVWALYSFLLLLNAAHTVRPLPPRSLFFHPSSHLSLTLFHPSRVTPVPLTPPRSTQSTAFISFLLPFRAYFASLERRCAFYALSAPDPSLNQNREETGVGGVLPDAVATVIRGKVCELIQTEAYESR